MDFYQIKEKMQDRRNEGDGPIKKFKVLEVYPDFCPRRSNDLMIRGRAFYAIWDEAKQMWSTDESDVQRLVDQELDEYVAKRRKTWDGPIEVKRMISFASMCWRNYRTFVREMYDTYSQLDENLTFSNTPIKKKDYVSKTLPYPLEEGPINAYDELVGTLYDEEERRKLEWAIGAIVAGDAKYIQKFIVLYGEAGSGKSTFLNIVQKLFIGYYTSFEAKELAGNKNAFSTETFRDNPLVAIQHDGDLSRIEDNTKLNSIISHEEMTMNEKYKAAYTARSNAFLFMGTNKPVKITDAKSGIIRRLIDVRPSGKKFSPQRYHELTAQIDFELGAIAFHCLQVYKTLGINYYSAYRPIDMMYQTDVFFNFVEDSYSIFSKQDGTNLAQAYEMYKTYCDEALVEFKLPKYKFREELKSYFKMFLDRTRTGDGKQVRSVYGGFLREKFNPGTNDSIRIETVDQVTITDEISQLDIWLKDSPAQYATPAGTPIEKWATVTTTLADLDTSQVHFVRPPENHIVIDFDLKGDDGQKSVEKNLEAAAKWPITYAEFSKSGAGIHLHYIYEGDVSRLSRIFADGIEIKVFSGNASLRRKFTKCNNSPLATLNSGLPLKGEKMIDVNSVQSEKKLRDIIKRNLNKEIHPGTKPSIDFIHKILEDAYSSGLKYDVTDMRPKILAFANNSTNQADYCIKLVQKMQFASDEPSESKEEYVSDELIFFDVEVFPNLFVVVWKKRGGNKVKWINPKPSQIEELMRFRLVGFNCRRYDNHILYACYIGYTNLQLFDLSQKIINGSRNAMFGEAYNISYTDVYDFSSKKQGLKRFQIELGIHHMELGLPWDEEVPEELWPKVADYCGNDVDATEAVFDDRKQDFIARLILADLSGLTPNDTTQMHTAKIIFGNDKRPQDKFVYPDLSEMFPGYKFENGKSTYKGRNPSEGGYVYAEPGMYTNVVVLDVASMHPSSILAMNAFGEYTSRYKELLDARLAIKHRDFEKARTLLGGLLNKYLDDPEQADDLAYALKIHALNIVYGLTSAKFDNKFRDPRNKDNIVAKRGALFMIDLQEAVQDRGFTVAHIKTDSIKIPNATQDIIDFVFDFGKKYGYTFEHEATFEKFCLVNDAVYIARYDDQGERTKGGKHAGEWTPTGTQFAHPYVFKMLFSHEPVEMEDLCEVKTVTSALYLDMNENLADDEHEYQFIGKAGAFYPILPGRGGGLLYREKDGKYYSAGGSKGYRWLEAEVVRSLGKEDDVDMSYYIALLDDAVETISKYGDFEWFISNSEESTSVDDPIGFNDTPPWLAPCGQDIQCFKCPKEKTCKHLPFN